MTKTTRFCGSYRGYMIEETLGGQFDLSKDNFHIAWANSPEHARAIIDDLLDGTTKAFQYLKVPRRKRGE